MKRLANLKNSSSEPSSNGTSKPSANLTASKSSSKKASGVKNSPYPVSEKPATSTPTTNSHGHDFTPPSGSLSYVSMSRSKQSLETSSGEHQPPMKSNKSTAPTVSTNPGTTRSEAAQSKAATATTGGGLSSSGIDGGEGSTFSSPSPSVRSMTTTLTTIQSAAPPVALGTNTPSVHAMPTTPNPSAITHFSHPFPTSPPASAIPLHVVAHGSGGHPATYNTATANNLLTDNASILTLASSSKRRRRNSLDTNASVRALAPSSVFGGSRESLPLSVLSTNPEDRSTGLGAHRAVAGLANTERASVYSSSGVVTALTSERNSYYANKQGVTGDGVSIRSGLISHGRNDSTTGSIGGIATAGSPLASPREPTAPGRVSRRNSGWGEVDEESPEDEREEIPARFVARESDNKK